MKKLAKRWRPRLSTVFRREHHYRAVSAISVENLNTLLDECFEKYAEKFTAQQWLDENDFNSAVGDDAVTVWMAK
ncbi:hypothetical protein WAI453_011889 [Rhynchosporium graminicola]